MDKEETDAVNILIKAFVNICRITEVKKDILKFRFKCLLFIISPCI